MSLSTILPLFLAPPFAPSLLELTARLLPLVARRGHRIVSCLHGPVTPAAIRAFEQDLQEFLREMGRVIFEWVVNQLETDDILQAPERVDFDRDVYRRRSRSPRRGASATLSGIIALWRIRYEPYDGGIGLRCIFPLEQRLGIVAGKPTAALASRVGPGTAQKTQENGARGVQ